VLSVEASSLTPAQCDAQKAISKDDATPRSFMAFCTVRWYLGWYLLVMHLLDLLQVFTKAGTRAAPCHTSVASHAATPGGDDGDYYQIELRC